MRRPVAVAASIAATFIAWSAAAASAQEPEAVSAAAVEEIRMSRAKNWTPSHPEKIGVLVVIRLPLGSYGTEDLSLAYGSTSAKNPKAKGSSNRAPALGYATGGGWAITDGKGKGWKLSTGKPSTDLKFLFEVPKGTSEVTLLYKGKPAGAPLTVSAPSAS